MQLIRDRRPLVAIVLACLFLTTIAAHAQQEGKKAYQFKGKVQKVDASSRTVTVDGENIEGWMAAMTMTYRVDKPEVLTELKAGDTITATVYDGDFTTLHGVKAAASAGSAAAAEMPPLSVGGPPPGKRA